MLTSLLEGKHSYLLRTETEKEQQDRGSVEVGQMHCRLKKKSLLWLGEIKEGRGKQHQKNPVYQAI